MQIKNRDMAMYLLVLPAEADPSEFVNDEVEVVEVDETDINFTEQLTNFVNSAGAVNTLISDSMEQEIGEEEEEEEED